MDEQLDSNSMSTEIIKGRNISSIIISTLLSVYIIVDLIYLYVLGIDQMYQLVSSSAIFILLIFFFYRGANAARIVMLVLFGIAGIGASFEGISKISLNWNYFWLLMVGIIFTISSVMLASIKSIRKYQEYLRTNRLKEKLGKEN